VGAPPKLLLDENISPRLAQKLRDEDGVDAIGVRDRDMLAAKDPQVFELAYREDRVLVTSNFTDFEPLARRSDVHCGVVAVLSGPAGPFNATEQLQIIRRALLLLIAAGDVTNRFLYISLDEERWVTLPTG
jgi:predicted nuclease of predicted toxin-antitoxin system